MTYTAEQIERIGGNRWTGHRGQLRIYLNDWHTIAGLELHHYKTGNIAGAYLNGERISNAKGGRLASGKVWWADGKVWFQGISDEISDDLSSGIRRAVAEADVHHARHGAIPADAITQQRINSYEVHVWTHGACGASGDRNTKTQAEMAYLDHLDECQPDQPPSAPPAEQQRITPDADPAGLVADIRRAGRTARQIAQAIGVHVSTVYRWARGAFRPTAVRLAALTALAVAR